MKKICVPLVILIFLFTAISSGWCGEKKGPVAEVDQQEFSFDPVPEGVMIIHDFIMKNRGDDILKIENVKTS